LFTWHHLTWKGVWSPRKNVYREQARERAEEGQNSRKYSVALGKQADNLIQRDRNSSTTASATTSAIKDFHH
jgi:hypothetical protein